MTNKELIKLAANAIELKGSIVGSCYDFLYEKDGIAISWNPLTDDGDALRLAVKLDMGIEIDSNAIIEITYPAKIIEPIGLDPYAATRRAIVRAAAEIGRMK